MRRDFNRDGRAERHSTRYNKNNQLLRAASPQTKLSHLIAFNIKENNELISGILTIEFDYCSCNGGIKYRNIQYSDPRLIKHIEGNPVVMKNIDSYIRKNLLESEYGFKL